MRQQKEEGVVRKLIGLELIDKGIARKDYPIYSSDGKNIGIITSGTMSPSLSKAIAMAYLEKEFTIINTIVFIQVRKKKVRAKVTPLPFFK